MVDLEGRTYGWNSNYYNRDNTIVFSGDMTNAEPEATELFYIDRACPDGKISVSQYSGNPKSQFKLFVACEDMDTSKLYNAMCNPNSVVAEFMIPVENAANKQCAIIVDNRIYLMDLSAGAGRIPNHKYSSVYVDKLKNKCRTFIDLKPILEFAGFTEVTDENEEVDLDLSQISKDTRWPLSYQSLTPMTERLARVVTWTCSTLTRCSRMLLVSLFANRAVLRA
jgi:hypothetical protein